MDTRTECNWNGSAEIYEVEQVAFPREDRGCHDARYSLVVWSGRMIWEAPTILV